MKTQKAMLSAGIGILRLAILILVIVGVWRIGEVSYLYCYSIVADVAVDEAPGRDVRVTVDAGMKPKKLASLLEKKGLVEDADIFYFQMKINKYDDRIKEGDYVLNTSMTPRELMKRIAGEYEEEEEE